MSVFVSYGHKHMISKMYQVFFHYMEPGYYIVAPMCVCTV